MNPVFGFHAHDWHPYHITEIYYIRPSKASHQRMFETCMVCGQCRSKDLAPREIPPMILLQSEES